MNLREWWATSEWWTYHPSSFLMFSPRIYWRLFESANAAVHPFQWVLIAAALAWLAWGARDARRGAASGAGVAARWPTVVLAACWLHVAWAFLLQRYAPINWPALYFAVAFGAQAVLLIVLALQGGLRTAPCSAGRTRIGLALGLWALLGHPALVWPFDRPAQQAEMFGVAPDPTALATLAMALLLQAPPTRLARRLLRAAWIVPGAWCIASTATLATMGSAQAGVVLGALLVAVIAAVRLRPVATG